MEHLLDDDISTSSATPNNMIILANQIIAAMPDRIKKSPGHDFDDSAMAVEMVGYFVHVFQFTGSSSP